MDRQRVFSSRREGQILSSSFTALLSATLFVFFLCGVAQPAQARLERQTYLTYRTPHLCSYKMMEAVGCHGDKPMCCVASSAIRCCAGTTSCGNCTDVVVGYQMPKSSVILGCFSLSVLVLLGSIIMSGVGRHLAWVLERRRVIENYRKRLALRRAEAREFKKELAETEEKDIEDNVACVICCARHIDVALTPCGHVCCCRFCAKRLKECPVCRAGVQRCFDLPLYYVKQLVRATAEEGDGEEETAAGTQTAAPPAYSASERANAQGEEGALQTREEHEAHAAFHTSSSEACGDADAEPGVEVDAAQMRRFHPLHARRYTRLLSDDDDDEVEAATVTASTAFDVAVCDAARRASVALAADVASPTSSTTAAVRPAGFISVDK